MLSRSFYRDCICDALVSMGPPHRFDSARAHRSHGQTGGQACVGEAGCTSAPPWPYQLQACLLTCGRLEHWSIEG
jgi:hypothetical protein